MVSWRGYKIRRIDLATGEIDIDIVLHEGDETPGATFALEAQAGDMVGMTGPGGAELHDARWTVLAGDETALPAIARVPEEVPVDRVVIVFIEIAEDAERQEIASRAKLELHWLSRDERPAARTTLLTDAIRALPFPDDERPKFVWVGCEHASMHEIRKLVRKEHVLERGSSLIAAYWRRGTYGDVDEEG
jgi:NADPH-dependent ferric siderophore reductase